MDGLLLPGARLRPFVEGYWERRGTFAREKTVRVLADACTKLIFEMAPTPWEPSYVIGTQTAPILVGLVGSVDRFGLRFRPGMAGLFLDRPPHTTASPAAPAAACIGADAANLHRALSGTAGFAKRAAIIEEWLVRRLDSRRALLPQMRRTAMVYRRIVRGGSPAELAAGLGLGQRQLQRFCRQSFGTTAVMLHRLCRFQRLQARLCDPPLSLSDLAAELGYSDQAHMAREFRLFAGATMSEFQCERGVRVANLQDLADHLPVLRPLEEGLR